MKLGKLPPRHDPRTLKLENYLKFGALPPAPAARDWTGSAGPWTMMANDKVGDCTCAAAGHMIQEWTADESGKGVVLTDPDILAAYSAIAGYNAATGANDNGAVILDVLNYWRNTGIGGHKIAGYVSTEPGNHEAIRQAVNLFGSVDVGLALPKSAQGQSVWSVDHGNWHWLGRVLHYNPDTQPGSWGGHCVPIVAYDANFLVCVTWGSLMKMTWEFWDTYCDEAYAVLSTDWVTKGKSPGGFDLAQLQGDLAAMTNDK